MVSTEDFRIYQSIIRDLFNILQDEIYPIVNGKVEDWNYFHKKEDDNGNVVFMDGMDAEDRQKDILPFLDCMTDYIDSEILNGVLKVIASFRLYRSFTYPGVELEIKSIRQLQLRKKAGVV